jgi:hypothetical protein
VREFCAFRTRMAVLVATCLLAKIEAVRGGGLGAKKGNSSRRQRTYSGPAGTRCRRFPETTKLGTAGVRPLLIVVLNVDVLFLSAQTRVERNLP